MIKKIIHVLLAAVFCVILSGCSHEGVKDFNNTIIPDHTGNNEALNDYGIFYAKKGVIHMLDPLTGISAPLCSKVNCDHRGKTRDNPNPTCEAYFAEAVGYSAVIGDKLYCLVKIADEGWGSGNYFTKEFYCAEKNGTGRKLLFRADDIQYGTYGGYEDGYFLYGYYNTENPDGVELDKEVIGMCIVNLYTEQVTRICIDDKYNGRIWGMTICDGKLYYGLSYMTVDIKDYDYDSFTDHDSLHNMSELYKYEVRRYDLETGETEIVFESGFAYVLSLGYGHIFYSQDGIEYITRDLMSGKEYSVRKDSDDIVIPSAACGEGIIFIENEHVDLWRYGDEDVETIGKKDKNLRFSIEGVTSEWVYALLYNDKNEAVKVYCNKEDFMKGSFEWHEYDIR